jgi:hypothetical protein
LLPIMGKIFEESMLKRLRPILEENWILPDHQFGFRQKHSTVEQVHRITEIRSNKRNFTRKALLLCGVPRHHTSVWFSMARRPLVQNQKNPSPCILQNFRIISNG